MREREGGYIEKGTSLSPDIRKQRGEEEEVVREGGKGVSSPAEMSPSSRVPSLLLLLF